MILKKLIKKWDINNSWTLFLDRDGVINHETKGNYITSVNSFKFINGVEQSISKLNKIFNKIIIVTNQQGIGKKIMTEIDLKNIHNYMINEIESKGGRITAIYHSPFLTEEENYMQKPRIGMGIKAKKEFPEINFNQSIMVGNSERDLIFGRKLNMKTIYVGNANSNYDYDFCIKELTDLVR